MGVTLNLNNQIWSSQWSEYKSDDKYFRRSKSPLREAKGKHSSEARYESERYAVRKNLYDMDGPPDARKNPLRDKTILVTGATGFLGLALLLKLLSDAPCHKLYLLVRGGKEHFWEFCRQVLPSPQFESLRIQEDMIILKGDLNEPRLGLKGDEISHLGANVNIYIHLACSINLRRPLVEIAKSIIEPTLELAEIALASTSLERFVYISTAYANTHLHHQGEVDTKVTESIYPLRSGGGDSTDLELKDLNTSGTTPEYGVNNFPFPYCYAKHLTERLLLDRFRQKQAGDSLLIVRPSIIGPALREPFPYYEIRRSAPATNFLAAVVASLSLRMAFSSRLSDPMQQSTLDEVPVDLVVNRILMHTTHRSHGIVHAVAGATGRHTFGTLWQKAMSMRRLPWHPRPVWLDVDWHSPLLHDIGAAWVIVGTSFLFEDERVHEVWDRMGEEERAVFPLFMRDAEEFEQVSMRRGRIRNLFEEWLSRKGFPPILVNFLISRPTH